MSAEQMPQPRHAVETSASNINVGDQIETAKGRSEVTTINRRPSGEYDITLANEEKITLDSDDSIGVTH